MVTPKVPPDAGTFENMISSMNKIGGEPRATVLITHLYIEYLLDWILRREIEKPDKIIKRGFASKLELVDSFDIIFPNLMHDLWIVNEIRNQFAHNIDIESQDFMKEFAEKLGRMEYFKNKRHSNKVPTYNAYMMVMMQIYALLKNRFDSLPSES